MLQSKHRFLIQLADNSLIQSHRLQETLGKAPELEIDMALGNIGLDLLGQCRFLYSTIASSIGNMSEDTLAFTRDSWDMYNVLLVEQENGNFADIIAKNFYISHYTRLLYSQLSQSSVEDIHAFATKSLKELQYHVEYFDQWVIRLGDGTEESAQKMQDAILRFWDFTSELFEPAEYEFDLDPTEFPIEYNTLRAEWMHEIESVLHEATLQVPTTTWGHRGGKNGVHSEKLGFILGEMQYMQKSYPNMEW